MSRSRTRMPWAIVQAGHYKIAVDTRNVSEIFVLPEPVSIPDMPAHVRGTVNLRGSVLPLLDLRTLVGLESLNAECDDLCRALEQRERDHQNWLAELDSCIREGREFRLATDPHACAFGRWYDSFRADNLMVANFLRKFDAPHKAIHGLAAQAIALRNNGDKEAALRLIDTARHGTLQELLRLFTRLRQLMRETAREVGLVVRDGPHVCSLAADAVDSVEILEDKSVEPIAEHLLSGPGARFVRKVARRSGDRGLVLLLDAARVLDCARTAA